MDTDFVNCRDPLGGFKHLGKNRRGHHSHVRENDKKGGAAMYCHLSAMQGGEITMQTKLSPISKNVFNRTACHSRLLS